MRGADERLSILKAKVDTCRNKNGSSKTDNCERLSTQKNCA